MKSLLRVMLVTSSTVLLYGQRAIPQQPVAPPPKPADSSPSLAVTMQFIQGKLGDIGKVNYVAFYQDTADGSKFSHTFTVEVSNLAADQSQCRISFHWKATTDGATSSDSDVWFSLSNVQDVVVRPLAQHTTEGLARAGRPNLINTSTNPPLTALLVRFPHHEPGEFLFAEVDLADRLARAIRHAVELCGGGRSEPF